MTTITFDTLKFVETLKTHGMHEEQAKGVAEAFRDAQGEAELATRRDIDNVRRDLAETELRLKHEIELARLEMRDLERRMTIKLGAMMMIAIGVVAMLVKLL